MLQQNEIQAVIDEVISRVLKQTGQSLVGTDSAGNADAGAKVLQARVITTAQVPAESGEGDLVILRQDAVITPAAIDLFKDRASAFSGCRLRPAQMMAENSSANCSLWIVTEPGLKC